MPPGRPHTFTMAPGRYRPILPLQSEAQAADQARAMALQDPVQPAPVTTDHFSNPDFTGFETLTLDQGLVYPEYQTQVLQPPHHGMLSPHNMAAWEGQMQAGWGGFSSRNAGVEQLSVDTPTTGMYGMSNAAGKLRIAFDTGNLLVRVPVLIVFQHMMRWTSCLPSRANRRCSQI